jgi:hypothetical protein
MVTVTVGVESGGDAVIGADVAAGVSESAWTAGEPVVDEHPAAASVASVTRHARPRHPVARVARARCGSCGFSVMP